MDKLRKAYTIKVLGKVQGVGFRFYTQKKAIELGIDGFVRNMRDGSVYIEAQASQEQLENFIQWVRQGPDWARVDDIILQQKPVEDFKDFQIK
jgi:acylphosphatase